MTQGQARGNSVFEKKNHHYIPRFWLKQFANQNGQIWGYMGGRSRPVRVGDIMQVDWLYTIFDDRYTPSDELENALSADEARAAPVVKRVIDGSVRNTEADWNALCDFLGLQACRHPDILRQGFRRARELGAFFCDSTNHSQDEFRSQAVAFGLNEAEADFVFEVMGKYSTSDKEGMLRILCSLSPQSPELPEQEALRAAPNVAEAIKKLHCRVGEAPSHREFVLGDTPVPQHSLAGGFAVPLSKSVSLIFSPPGGDGPVTHLARGMLTEAEVDQINLDQYESAKELTIASDRVVLEALVANSKAGLARGL